MSTDDEQDDPFKCPECGQRDVRVSGGGKKTCTSCPWEYRPAGDTQTETKQVGVTDY